MKVNFNPITNLADHSKISMKIDPKTPNFLTTRKMTPEEKDTYISEVAKMAIDKMMKDMIDNPQTIPERMKEVFPKMVENWKKSRNM